MRTLFLNFSGAVYCLSLLSFLGHVSIAEAGSKSEWKVSMAGGGYYLSNISGETFDASFGVKLRMNNDNEVFVERYALELVGINIPDQAVQARLDIIYPFKLKGGGWTPFVSVGAGGLFFHDAKDAALVVYGGGVELPFATAFDLRFDIRHGFYFSSGRTRSDIFELTAGIAYTFGKPLFPSRKAVSDMPADDDRDGVANRHDLCPQTTPGDPVDATGCPQDSDVDGVPDSSDACPRTPADVAVDEEGCPLDFDADGVPDFQDRCSETPPGSAVGNDGCTFD